MILSDKDIQKEIKSKNITLKPFNEKSLQPASVDLHLDKEFLVFDKNLHTFHYVIYIFLSVWPSVN